VAAVLVIGVLSANPAGAATPRTSLTDVEDAVMCVSCREPLALAQSPQAFAERSYITTLVGQGLTKPQILQKLVMQYGTAVLAKPPAQGFDLLVYVLPPALLLAALVKLALVLARWRGRSEGGGPPGAGVRLSAADTRRLDEDLARFD